MRGSIRSRGQNSWQLQVYTGKDTAGKPTRYMETVRGKKADAQKRLTELLSGLDKGIAPPSSKMTVGQHFESWLDGYVKTNCSTRTYDGYESIIRHHLAPAFGSLALKQLTPQAIQAYYGRTTDTLSNRTILHFHRVLSQSLKYGVRQGYLWRNPCDMVDPPSPHRNTMRTLTIDEAVKLLEVAKDSFFYPIIYLAISTGLRQAEILGLRWRDIDLDMASLSVNQVLYKSGTKAIFKEPKTNRSRRRVALTAKLGLFLRGYKVERISMSHQLGKTLGLDDLVFTSYQGEPLNASVLSHAFSRLAKEAGLGAVRFHDLRHTFASLMLLRGAKPKVISEALGHASVAFTMDVYSHIIEGMQEDAMALLDGVLPDGHVQSFNVNLTSTVDNVASIGV